ncbi:MAG: hypothetical protein E7356_00130 [Clostridiales bacterium]|nr:hypothetical protein [Clostridiales bacterium]
MLNNQDIGSFNSNTSKLSELLHKGTTTNQSIIANINNYCNYNNISLESHKTMLVPTDSIPIIDPHFLDAGYINKYNNTLIISLPNNDQFIKAVFDQGITRFLAPTIAQFDSLLTLRCYGTLLSSIKQTISNELNNSSINITFVNNRLDTAIYIRYNSTQNAIAQPIIAEICSKLNNYIYSTDDTNLYETATNLLSIQRKKLAIVETITNGNIAHQLNKHNANNLIQFSQNFTNQSAILEQFRVDDKLINHHGFNSVNIVYELDNLLIQKTVADIAIFVLGDINDDMCYVAIGDLDGIHVYKNKINHNDTSLIDTLSETTMFYLIKKLKQNDYKFLV